MKRSNLSLIIAVIGIIISGFPGRTSAQSGNQLGISFSSFGENHVFRFQELLGSASVSGQSYFTLGIDYLHPLGKRLSLESGIEFSHHNLTINPNVGPLIDAVPRETELTLVNVPIGLRLDFLKYFYLNGDMLLTIDTGTADGVDNLTGIGADLGLGIKYEFNFGLALYTGLYSRAYALVPLMSDDYPQRLWESGLTIGALYRLK